MTSNEKKIFFLGAGAGLLGALIVAAMLTAKSMHVFASQPASSPVPAHIQAARSPSQEQQGTLPGTTVQLSPTEMTAAGVQVADVRTAILKTNINAFGRVEQPESQLAAVSAWMGGRVDKLYVQYTGELVHRGQPVADIYSPEVATAIEDYRLAQQNRTQLSRSDDPFARTQSDSLVTASQRRLQLLGITAEQINAPATNGVPHVTIYSNGAGTVVERKVTQGQYVNAGETLLTLADLNEIWIKVDVYEEQLKQIHPGQDVEITSEAFSGRAVHGHVQFIEPNTNAQTRTVPVHVHLANSGMRLLPGMFVSAMFVSHDARPSVVVPRSAVLETGTREIVYLAKADGVFEAREVQVGVPSEDIFPVTSGLSAGDKVVLNGNFLIDSQAQLSSGMSGLYGGSKEFAAAQQGQPPLADTAQGAAKLQLHTPPEMKGDAENMFQASLTDASGKPIGGAHVTVTVVMPAMPAMNMPEMKNSFELPWIAASQMYAGNGKVPMAGSWTVLVEARKDGNVIASSHTRISAK